MERPVEAGSAIGHVTVKTIMLQKHLEAPKEAIVERGKELKVEGL